MTPRLFPSFPVGAVRCDAVRCGAMNSLSLGAQNPAVDQAVLRSFQRIKDIGQGVTVFTVSRLQTHSLISNTVQLW